MDTSVARLTEPRAGILVLTAALAVIMGAHWSPMLVPGCALLVLAILRPTLAARPHTWWVAAGLWLAAVALKQEHMEDHVYLFTAWLVALALALSADGDEEFVDRAAWHAKMLVSATFATAVAWKVYFGDYFSGTTLWLFMLVDRRFEPLASAVGLSDGAVDRGREGLGALLSGTSDVLVLEAPTHVVVRIAAAATLTLSIEFLIAAAHLAPDTSRLARLRLPSIVMFGLVTYAVVPVVPFAALLAMLAMVVGRWRREVLWVFPAMVLVSVGRLLMLS